MPRRDHCRMGDLEERRSLELVGRVALSVAHDFNNILVAIQGYALLLQERHAGNGTGGDELEEIVRATERASAVVAQLLALGGAPSGPRCRLDVGQALDELRPMLEQLAGRGVELATDVEQRVPAIRFSRGSFQRVLANLVLNAAQAMPRGGRITIRAVAHGRGFVRLTVSDTGSGIADEHLPRVFDPFYTTKPPGTSSGLGLASVRELLLREDAGIRVETMPGAGTTFSLYLPVYS